MPRPNEPLAPGTIFFGKQAQFTAWQSSGENVDMPTPHKRANLPASFRILHLDPNTEAVDRLPNTWPHWGALIAWIEQRTGEADARQEDDVEVMELSNTMGALLRRARVLNGVAIPSRASGETVELDLDNRPADIHALFFGTYQRYREYCRVESRRAMVPRAAILHINLPTALHSRTISASTQIIDSLDHTNPHWWAYYQATMQMLARSALQTSEAHPTVGRFVQRSRQLSAIEAIYLGSEESYTEWRSREGRYLNTSNMAQAWTPDDVNNLVGRVTDDTEIIDQIPRDYPYWRTLRDALLGLFIDSTGPHRTVIDFLSHALAQAEREDMTTRVVPAQTIQPFPEALDENPATHLREASLRLQVEELRAILQAIEDDADRDPAYRLAAAHARRVSEGQHILWVATDAPQDYRLIAIGEHGNADTLICRWNTDTGTWVANSDEVWVRR